MDNKVHIESIMESYRRTGHLTGAVSQVIHYLPYKRSRKEIEETLNAFLTIPERKTYQEHLNDCAEIIMQEPDRHKKKNKAILKA